MDACAGLPIEDAVDVERGELRIVGQQLVDGLLNLGKSGGGILHRVYNSLHHISIRQLVHLLIDTDSKIPEVSHLLLLLVLLGVQLAVFDGFQIESVRLGVILIDSFSSKSKSID